jgi:hypothetical protein
MRKDEEEQSGTTTGDKNTIVSINERSQISCCWRTIMSFGFGLYQNSLPPPPLLLLILLLQLNSPTQTIFPLNFHTSISKLPPTTPSQFLVTTDTSSSTRLLLRWWCWEKSPQLLNRHGLHPNSSRPSKDGVESPFSGTAHGTNSSYAADVYLDLLGEG